MLNSLLITAMILNSHVFYRLRPPSPSPRSIREKVSITGSSEMLFFAIRSTDPVPFPLGTIILGIFRSIGSFSILSRSLVTNGTENIQFLLCFEKTDCSHREYDKIYCPSLNLNRKFRNFGPNGSRLMLLVFHVFIVDETGESLTSF